MCMSLFLSQGLELRAQGSQSILLLLEQFGAELSFFQLLLSCRLFKRPRLVLQSLRRRRLESRFHVLLETSSGRRVRRHELLLARLLLARQAA